MPEDLYDIASLAEVGVSVDVIERVAATLDLRPPNKAAVANVAAALANHERSGSTETLEVVVDSAVGVGKTYVMAGLIEYLAEAEGVRNVAIVTPSTVINEKTIENFTEGTARSLTAGMETRPVVVTAENFDTPAMRAVLDDDTRVKIFVFTVQSLLIPRKGSKARTRTHSYQEGLGRGLYQHLADLPDLVVLADEHHAYFGDAFSRAIRELTPRLLVGLTGTPDERSEDLVVFRYPLADAIADGYVKMPVIVGRRDDRRDTLTKLNDGVFLLEEKQAALDRYSQATGAPRVNAVMLVLCRTIAEAEETAALIESDAVANGRYKDHVLAVHSRAETHEDDLRNLAAVEHPDSPVRIIVAVDKLKEGWDVKNVFVLLSLRPSVSTILTEQTLGRGLRLPFGKRTGREFLDTLEVLAHERYEALLRQRDALNERFVSYRTRQTVVHDKDGVPTLRTETTTSETQVLTFDEAKGANQPESRPTVADLDQRAEAGAEALRQDVMPDWSKTGNTEIKVPRLVATRITVPWSLAQITDFEPFRDIARRLAKTRSEDLARTVITAERRGGKASVGTREAADRVTGFHEPLPLEEAKQQLRTAVLSSRIAPSRAEERGYLDQILDKFYEALGPEADRILTEHWATAANRIVSEIEKVAKAARTQVQTSFDVRMTKPFGARLARPETTTDLRHKLAVSERNKLGYEGWRRSLYPQVWFDSDPERRVALILDTTNEIEWWVRLHGDDISITWNDTRSYEPDFLAKTEDGTWWVIEVKADSELQSEAVQAKATAAKEWANRISMSDAVEGKWRYLLVGEKDVEHAKGSWRQLLAFGR